MEEKMEKIEETKVINFAERKISRKEAIKRTGYIAASAATMMVLLSNPSQANGRSGAQSSPCTPPPTNHGGNDRDNNHREHSGHRR